MVELLFMIFGKLYRMYIWVKLAGISFFMCQCLWLWENGRSVLDSINHISMLVCRTHE